MLGLTKKSKDKKKTKKDKEVEEEVCEKGRRSTTSNLGGSNRRRCRRIRARKPKYHVRRGS